MPHRGKILITWLFVPRKRPNEKLKSYLQTRKNADNFVKIVQTSRPWGENLWPKFEILTFLGLFSHISSPINVKFGEGERTWGPRPLAKFHVYRVTCRPCERKTNFGPLSKNNTDSDSQSCYSRRMRGLFLLCCLNSQTFFYLILKFSVIFTKNRSPSIFIIS